MDHRPLSRPQATDRRGRGTSAGDSRASAARSRTRDVARRAASGLTWRRRASLTLAQLALALTALALVPLGTDAAGTASNGFVEQGGKLTGAGEGEGGQLGASMALSGDGATLLVGAPKDGRGAAYVFTREGSTWQQQGERLTPPEASGGEECTGEACTSEECAEEAQPGETVNECAFGTSAAISEDGDIAIVGDPSAGSSPGAAWVFTREGSTWTRTAVLVGPGEPGEGRFGRSVALSADGTTALIGDPSARGQRGGAYMFTREGSTWTLDTTIVTDEAGSTLAHAGRSVALSADGETALLGGPGDDGYTGAVWAFTRSGEAWSQLPGKLVGASAVAGDHLGKAVALSADGETALVGAQNAVGNHGAVWTFARGESGFAQAGSEIEAYEAGEAESEGRFGASMALSGDGETALIGAPQAEAGVGSVTVLRRSGSTWTRAAEHLAGSGAVRKSWMGSAVALSADGMTAAVGATRDSKQAGAAWVFHGEAQTKLPVVTNVVPGHGPTAGGATAEVTGKNLNGASEVRFGASAATILSENGAEIAVRTPPGAAGRVDVTVTTPVGTSATSAKDRYVYEEAGTSGEGEGEGETPKQPTKGLETHGEATPPGDGSSAAAKTSVAAGGVAGFTATASDCRVALAKTRLAVTRYRAVALRLVRKGTGACRGSVAVSYRVKARGRGDALRTIGTASFSISTQASVVVNVKLSKAGQRWLRAHKGTGRASVSIARVYPTPTLAQTASVRLSVKHARKTTPRKR
jgi:IPT/TIG domain/FG-GAP repeat